MSKMYTIMLSEKDEETLRLIEKMYEIDDGLVFNSKSKLIRHVFNDLWSIRASELIQKTYDVTKKHK